METELTEPLSFALPEINPLSKPHPRICYKFDERTTKPRGGRDQNIYAILEWRGACFMIVELAGIISKYMGLFAASLEVGNDLTCEDSVSEPESRTSNSSQILPLSFQLL